VRVASERGQARPHHQPRPGVRTCLYDTGNARHAFKNLQAALVDLYGALLELLANSTKLFAKNTAKQTVYAILHPGETADLFSKLVDLETRLDREVQACESGRSAAADAKLTKLLEGLMTPLARVDDKVGSLLEQIDKTKQLQILGWISLISYGKHHDTVTEARTSDTCEWLLQHKRFLQWWETNSSAIMWLQGSRTFANLLWL
jgi:hypothetical protein